MKKTFFVMLIAKSLFASNEATQNLILSFGTINTISFINELVEMPLIIDQADAGGGLQKKVNLEQGLSYQTYSDNMKIIAFLDRPTPTDTFLSVEVLEPIGTGTGKQFLSNYPVDLIINIPESTCPGAGLKYVWEAKITAGPHEISTYTVTYAITPQ